LVALTPAPNQLNLDSPALGPWFVPASGGTGTSPVTLGAPAADLSIPVTLAPMVQWWAPAGATLSFFVVTDPRPEGLAPLRQVDGSPAFGDGRLVALVRLLPGVENRLAALVGAIVPAVSGTAPAAPASSRAVVRHLALDLPLPADMAGLRQLLAVSLPADVTGDETQAAFLGLSYENQVIGNAARPMTELHRPGFGTDPMLQNGTGANLSANLWAFDDRGRPIDPGAVAAWWAFLASGDPQFDNLWANGNPNLQYVATPAPGRFVQFCNPAEGPASSVHMGRLSMSGLTAVGASPSLFSYQAGANSGITLTAAPTPDDMPVPRIGTLPTGPYNTPNNAPLFTSWNAPTVTLQRDFVRIAVTDVERQLVGLDRTDPLQADSDARIPALANTAPNPVLIGADAVAGQVLTVLGASPAAAMMAPAIDLDFSALAPPAFGTGVPAGALPAVLAPDVLTLAGIGTDNGDSVSGQSVVVELVAGSLPAGGWVRIWPLGLDPATGRRFRMDGGGGLADANGAAFVVVPLPDGTDGARLSVDALVVASTGSRLYTDIGFDRPPVDMTGGSVPMNSLGPYTVWSCEQGQAIIPGSASVIGGASLLAVPQNRASDPFRLIDPASLTGADMIAQTLRNGAGAGDTLVLTEPAFVAGSEGDVAQPSPPAVTGPTGPNGATVVYRGRNALLDDIFDTTSPLQNATLMGRPLPMMERRELLAVEPATVTAAVGAHTGRARMHESFPALQGHPGLPAAPETHATGIALAGPAAAGTIAGGPMVLMRERTSTNLIAFLNAAANAVTPPVAPPPPVTYAAVLETIAAGAAGDLILRELLRLSQYQPGDGWDAFKAEVQASLGFSLEPLINAAIADDTLAAAVDSVFRKTRDGATQGATSLIAAIGAAEDFVYVETPALDTLSAASGGIDLVAALTARLASRPNLRVMLCVPERFLPEQPDRLEEIRQAGVAGAVEALAEAAPGRFIAFAPVAGPGRPLHMGSTVVIVDDVYLLGGTTHLWRRGLTFDSSLAVAVTDDAMTLGRPAAILAARRQLLANGLGVAVALVPDDPAAMQTAIERLVQAEGLGRISPELRAPPADVPSETDLAIWNPDGTPGPQEWLGFLRGLLDDAADMVNNAIR